MARHALKILSDRSTYFRWVLFGVTDDEVEFRHSEAPCEFHSYDAALSEGLQALADVEARAGREAVGATTRGK